MTASSLLNGAWPDFIVVLGFLLPVFFGTYLLLCVEQNARIRMKQLSELCGGQPARTRISVSEVSLQDYTYETNATVSVPLGNIKKAVWTKRLILLVTSAKLAYILPKDSFLQGNSGELCAFLDGVGIRCK